MVATASDFDPDLVEERPGKALGWKAARPARSVLRSERAWVMPPLEDALARDLQTIERFESESIPPSVYLC